MAMLNGWLREDMKVKPAYPGHILKVHPCCTLQGYYVYLTPAIGIDMHLL